jgi:pentatricopeptide repeat protein
MKHFVKAVRAQMQMQRSQYGSAASILSWVAEESPDNVRKSRRRRNRWLHSTLVLCRAQCKLGKFAEALSTLRLLEDYGIVPNLEEKAAPTYEYQYSISLGGLDRKIEAADHARRASIAEELRHGANTRAWTTYRLHWATDVRQAGESEDSRDEALRILRETIQIASRSSSISRERIVELEIRELYWEIDDAVDAGDGTAERLLAKSVDLHESLRGVGLYDRMPGLEVEWCELLILVLLGRREEFDRRSGALIARLRADGSQQALELIETVERAVTELQQDD